ncbi:MAG: ATP-binding cassette subfamily C protein LapB, partial [Motiliproteus sp.]
QIAAGSPQGLNLEISEGGEGLSGGQKQMVGLGRLLLSRPRIWLLDEPTASLDSQADTRVMSALNQQFQADDIVLISTHRPAQALAHANRVIVMHEGRVIEDGKPDQVIPKMMGQRAAARSPSGSPAMKPLSRGPGHVI